MKRYILPVVLLLLIAGCNQKNKEFPNSIVIKVTNNLDEKVENALLHVDIDELKSKASDFNADAFIVTDGDDELASQVNDKDSEMKGIVAILKEIGPHESKKLLVRYNPDGTNTHSYPKLTHAELAYKVGGEWKDREYIGGEFKNVDYMRVPPEHKDHSWFIRYEGPGWESDKVGYRFYLDERNANDVFGKGVTEPVLQNVGLDGFDSYHEMQDWGMDVMKVGPSLGVGSIGIFQDTAAVRVEFTDSVTSEITQNGVVYSSILTKYYGWKTSLDTIDITSQLSIHAGTRVTSEILHTSADLDQFCTGLVKDKKAERFTLEPTTNACGYLATYGPQSLNNDNLGIAVFFSSTNFNGFTEDQYSHIVKLKSSGGKLQYYFLAAWEGEPGGIKTKKEFLKYLNDLSKQLANPVSISYP